MTVRRRASMVPLAAVLALPACGFIDPAVVTLHNAASYHGPDVVRTKLDVFHQPVDERDKQGRTPLMDAADSPEPGALLTMPVLIEHGADVNAADPRGKTVLMYASTAMWCHAHGTSFPPGDVLARMRLLIDAGADVNARDNEGRTVLMVTAAAGSFEQLPDGAAATLLVQAGARLEDRDPQGRTALMHAAANSTTSIASLLIAGAGANAADNQGWTPLMHALHNRDGYNEGDLKELISAGASLDAVDHEGRSALTHAALFAARPAQLQALLAAGANTEDLGWTPQHEAAALGDLGALAAALSAGADPNARDRLGRTPLMWACRFWSNDDKAGAALLQVGADVDAVDAEGATALHIAAAGAGRPHVWLLLHNGAAINARDARGRTPLLRAAGADTTAGRYQCEYLADCGADVNAQDNDGATALIFFVRNRPYDYEQITALVRKGADPTLADNAGKSARDYADAYKNWPEVHRALGVAPPKSP